MESKVIKITKTVSKKIPADTVSITLRASGEAKTTREASIKADAVADSVTGMLKAAGFDGVRAGRITVNAKRAERKVVGFTAVRTFTVEFGYDGAKLGKAMETLADCACEYSLSFELRDRSAADELVAQAVRGARADAENIAKAAGVKLGALAVAEYCSQDGDGAVPALLCARSMDGYAGAANTTQPEDISLSETVVCSWEIL